MKDTLKPGLRHEFRFIVTEDKTVPFLFPESAEFRRMPGVLATGFMVGLFEWVCIQAINPHIDWPREQTVGTHINLSHVAPTPPGMTVKVSVELTEAEGKKLTFSVEAHDNTEKISGGTHERFVIDAGKFNLKVAKKQEDALG